MNWEVASREEQDRWIGFLVMGWDMDRQPTLPPHLSFTTVSSAADLMELKIQRDPVHWTRYRANLEWLCRDRDPEPHDRAYAAYLTYCEFE